ncbi:MAG: RNA polymerase sigma factor [Opitutaceae bacterium]|nr:RNA polymerase sigma factor [Opitutaceae bacterium]
MIAPAGPGTPLSSVADRSERGARSAVARQQATDDIARVRRFLQGDEDAFGEIMAIHREPIHTLALSFLKNHADAEEITQDTFIRAHRGLREFRGDSSLATWLHRIALNLARNRYWYFHRRRRHVSVSLDAAFSETNAASFADLVSTDAPDPMRLAVTEEFSRLVSDCMARLGERPRRILNLRNTLNHSYGEIARETGISVGTVKSRIARARVSLRRLLAEACPEFSEGSRPMAWLEPVRPSPGITRICA